RISPGSALTEHRSRSGQLLWVMRGDEAAKGREVALAPGESTMICRLYDKNELVELIQNRGLGLLRRAFAGYDLHSYEPLAASQDRHRMRGICGVCKLVTRASFEAVGGFDPKFFMYYEDLDFSLRLREMGYRPEIVEHAHLSHIHAG